MATSKKEAQALWTAGRKTEAMYSRHLRALAKEVGRLIRGFDLAKRPGDAAKLEKVLRQYADTIDPWARSVAEKVLQDVARRDYRMWQKISKEIGRGLKEEVAKAPTGNAMQKLMADQVELIKSIPLQSAERVHELAIKSVTEGLRSESLMKEILRTENIAESRARLIARTEIARAQATLTQARAEFAGSTHYVWVTSHDSDVRSGHKEMDGKVCEWANPPEVDEGGRIMRHHPGEIWNCRCYARPILPDL